jgi:Predicted Zn-dependent proteases and their inactivated homologs
MGLNKNIADKALEMAMEMGCSASRIVLNYNSNSCYTVRNDKLDRLHQATSSSLYIQMFTEGRYGSFSTNRMDEAELRLFIKKAIETTKLLAPDICRALPPNELYYNGDGEDLLQSDRSIQSIDPSIKKDIAFRCASEVYGKDKRVLSVNSDYSDSEDYAYIVDSQGFAQEGKETIFTVTTECSVKDDSDARPEGWWFHSSIFFDDLQKIGIGERALERALSRLSPQKMKSGRYSVVLENTVSNRVVAPIISALNGAALQQNNSFLKDKLGKRLFPESFNLFDTPHIKRMFGARYFDGEGIATKPIDIIKEGVVNTYFINTYYSNKLRIPITIEGPSILQCKLSSGRDSGNLKEILREVGTGIFITGFNGGNSNSSTGDFSFGINGFYFEKGEIQYPVKEMNITGNLISLWNDVIAIGNDPTDTGRWRIPTLAFKNANLSGL